MTETINPDTARFILEFTKDGPENLINDGDQMDTKAFSLFGIASAVVGLATFAFADGSGAVVTALLTIAMLLYTSSLASILQVVRKRTYHGGDYAEWTWQNCYGDPVEDVVHALASGVPSAVKHNQAQNAIKARWMARAHYAIAGQTVAVAAALIASRL